MNLLRLPISPRSHLKCSWRDSNPHELTKPLLLSDCFACSFCYSRCMKYTSAGNPIEKTIIKTTACIGFRFVSILKARVRSCSTISFAFDCSSCLSSPREIALANQVIAPPTPIVMYPANGMVRKKPKVLPTNKPRPSIVMTSPTSIRGLASVRGTKHRENTPVRLLAARSSRS